LSQEEPDGRSATEVHEAVQGGCGSALPGLGPDHGTGCPAAGIGESTLQSWVKNVKDEGDVAAGETPLTQAEKKRIRDLEAELRRVNMENAFLKMGVPRAREAA
jgi:hypothetical protein